MVSETNKFSWYNRLATVAVILMFTLVVSSIWASAIQPEMSASIGVAQVNGGSVDAASMRMLSVVDSSFQICIWLVCGFALLVTLWKPVASLFIPRKGNV